MLSNSRKYVLASYYSAWHPKSISNFYLYNLKQFFKDEEEDVIFISYEQQQVPGAVQ